MYKRQAIAREGGIGVIHKSMPIDDQAEQVDMVKRSENGVITNPFYLGPDNTLGEADALMAKYRISGVPVVDADGVLIGIKMCIRDSAQAFQAQLRQSRRPG